MADPNTPGWKTSEFWIATVTAVFAGLNGSGVLPFKIPDDIIAMIAGVVGTFIIGRLGLKVANANAEAKIEIAKTEADAKVEAAKVAAENK